MSSQNVPARLALMTRRALGSVALAVNESRVVLPIGSEGGNSLLRIDDPVTALQRGGQRPGEALAAPGEEREFVGLALRHRHAPEAVVGNTRPPAAGFGDLTLSEWGFFGLTGCAESTLISTPAAAPLAAADQ